MKLFHRKIPDVVPFPTLHPMGPYTFAIACMLCLHRNRGDEERCSQCLREVKSGFEIDPEAYALRIPGDAENSQDKCPWCGAKMNRRAGE